MGVTFIERDKGFRRWIQDLSKKGKVEVGVLGAKAARAHKTSNAAAKRKVAKAGRGQKKAVREAAKKRIESVATIASKNEFGFGKSNPKRSFIRAWLDSQKGRANLKKLQRALAVRRFQKKETVESSLKKIGVFAVGQIKKFIADGVPPPNDPATIARKGSSKPLIATGQMRSSITYRLTK